MHACINASIQTLLSIDSSDESTAEIHSYEEKKKKLRLKDKRVKQKDKHYTESFFPFFECFVCVSNKTTDNGEITK